MYEQYLTYFYTYILPPILAAIGGYMLHARKWWGNKTAEERKATLKDAIACLHDGKISIEDINGLIDKHL